LYDAIHQYIEGVFLYNIREEEYSNAVEPVKAEDGGILRRTRHNDIYVEELA